MMRRFSSPPRSPRRPRSPSSFFGSSSSSFDSVPSFSEQLRIDWSVHDGLCTPCTEEEIPCLPRLKEFMLKELNVAAGSFRRLLFIGNDYQDHIFRWRRIRMPTAVPNSFMSIDVKELRPTDLPDLEEWINVLYFFCSLRHPHLVKPIGFCLRNGTRLLVHISSPNGTLADNLFQHKLLSGRSEPLSWATRIKVAIGVAKGLSFLHDAKNQVIHGNVRASNIVLDSVIRRRSLMSIASGLCCWSFYQDAELLMQRNRLGREI